MPTIVVRTTLAAALSALVIAGAVAITAIPADAGNTGAGTERCFQKHASLDGC